jgi:hypothetical protein
VCVNLKAGGPTCAHCGRTSAYDLHTFEECHTLTNTSPEAPKELDPAISKNLSPVTSQPGSPVTTGPRRPLSPHIFQNPCKHKPESTSARPDRIGFVSQTHVQLASCPFQNSSWRAGSSFFPHREPVIVLTHRSVHRNAQTRRRDERQVDPINRTGDSRLDRIGFVSPTLVHPAPCAFKIDRFVHNNAQRRNLYQRRITHLTPTYDDRLGRIGFVSPTPVQPAPALCTPQFKRAVRTSFFRQANATPYKVK